MVKYCIAYGCRNKEPDTKTNKGLHFHSLPLTRPLILKQWLQNMKLKNPSVNKYSRLCSHHFSPNCYVRDFKSELLGLNLKKQLKKDAVPTIFDFRGYATHTDAPTVSTSSHQHSQRFARLNERNKKKEILQVSSFHNLITW